MINKADYEFLKSKYGHIASWTIWDKAPAGEEKTKKNVGGSEWCSDEETLIRQIHGKYVFVAANPYNKETVAQKKEKNETKLPWCSNFHSIRSIAQDYKLRYATAGTEMEGCYITDLIKDVRSQNVTYLKAEMKKDSSILERNIAEFKEEISRLSAKPIIIALGKDVYDWLKPLYNEYKVFRMSHYSNYINLDNYKKEALDIISRSK